MEELNNNLVCIGLISRSHGVKGDVLVKSFTQKPMDVASYGPVKTRNGIEILLNVIGKSRDQLIVRIEGFNTRDQSDALKGELIYIDKAKLPKITECDEYYHNDLIGMKVLNEDNNIFGVVVGIYDFGAGDIIEICNNTGEMIMAPFVKSFVKKVDVTNSEIVMSEEKLIKYQKVS